MMARTLSVESAGSAMGLYEAQPQGAARNAVIVIQEAFGVTGYIQDVCRRFAAAGYCAVAPHLFHRSGDPTIAYDQMQQVLPHVMRLDAEGLEADLDATLRHLTDTGFQPAQVAVVGFCMGGSVAFLAAARRSLGGAVTFYGGGIIEGRFGIPPLVDLAVQLKTPWLGLYGDLDQTIPVEQVESLRRAVEAVAVPCEIVRYAQAGHGFHCDARGSYHEASARDAWQRTLRWLDGHLRSP